MFDTRSGFWLIASIAVTGLLATIATVAFAPDADLTYYNFAKAIGYPITVILPDGRAAVHHQRVEPPQRADDLHLRPQQGPCGLGQNPLGGHRGNRLDAVRLRRRSSSGT